MKTADQVYRLRIFFFSFARHSKCRLSLEAPVEILADRDSDLRDLDEESDFYKPSDTEESSKEEMFDENVEDSPDKCEREESKMAAGWWVYKAPVGKGLMLCDYAQQNQMYHTNSESDLGVLSLKIAAFAICSRSS